MDDIPVIDDHSALAVAIEQARMGRAEGGVPIGAALIIDGRVVGAGRNCRIQAGSAIRHGETDALENAGRLPASAYRRATMVTTLSPCDMCTGAILLYGIPRVVIGERRTFVGGEDLLRARGVEVVCLDSDECYELLQGFIAEQEEAGADEVIALGEVVPLGLGGHGFGALYPKTCQATLTLAEAFVVR